MKWNVESQDGAVVVTMRSDPVNKMNPEYFDDLNEALDLVDRAHPRMPLVLTAEGGTFSAGLDFEDVFPRFARNDMVELGAWFDRFKQSLLRVFTMPRRTVAAVNGNAFAGGLILAVSCDHRIAAEGKAKFAINEVPVGIPMPGTYTEIVRYAVGSPAAAQAILSGKVYDLAGALALGFVHEVVAADGLRAAAVAQARIISEDSFSAYAASKKILQYPTMKRFETDIPELDRMSMQVVMAEDSVRAQSAAMARLKKKA